MKRSEDALVVKLPQDKVSWIEIRLSAGDHEAVVDLASTKRSAHDALSRRKTSAKVSRRPQGQPRDMRIEKACR